MIGDDRRLLFEPVEVGNTTVRKMQPIFSNFDLDILEQVFIQGAISAKGVFPAEALPCDHQ